MQTIFDPEFAQNIVKWGDQIRALDIKAGQIIGNADHVRAQGMSGFEYALDLGVRIFILGLTTALLTLTLAFFFMLNASDLFLFAGATYGFSLYATSAWLYPQKDSVRLALVMTLGAAAFVGAGAGLNGLDANTTLALALPQVMQTSLGLLFALYIMDGFGKLIARAFTTTEEEEARQRRHNAMNYTLRQLRRKKLLMLEEASVIKDFDSRILKAMLWLEGSLLILLAGVVLIMNPSLLALLVLGVGFFSIVGAGRQFSRLTKAREAFIPRVIERATADGYIEEPRQTLADFLRKKLFPIAPTPES